MASSLASHVNNLAEEIHEIKCKFMRNLQNPIEIWCLLPLIYNFKDDLIEYKCLYCNKNYQKQSDENLMGRFFTAYKFSNLDANKYIFLLPKDI